MKEIWKPIPGYEAITLISNRGNLKNKKHFIKYKNRIKGKIRNIIAIRKEEVRRPHINTCGYRMIGLRRNGKRKLIGVHRLVAITFIPNPNKYTEINHKDGNKLNNNVNNLEWCTKKYNTYHALRNGLKPTKLNPKSVKEIRRLYKEGSYKMQDLADIFKVSKTSICQTINYKAWFYI